MSSKSNRALVVASTALISLGWLSGCATNGIHKDETTATNGTIPAVAPEAPPTTSDLSDSGADLKAVPLAVNRQVLQWIDYFQGQGRPHMERYLSRSSRYMPMMREILKKQGVPEDLIYIVLIESGFSATAHSSANAVGFWQFIKGTGKRYGLKVDSYVDERRDFVRSTEAAAGYFKGLYDIFGAWYLAIASYNVGEGRVKNVVTKYHTRDFWQLARENKLPEETSNYVPKYIAARLIAKEPEKYGFTDIDYQAPVTFDEVTFATSVDLRKLAKEMNIEYDDLRDLNESYKRGVAFVSKSNSLKLRVPKGLEAAALAAAANSIPESKRTYVADEDYSYYRVRRGDTIATIAKKFGTSQHTIRTLNRLRSGSRLATGRRLRVPAEQVGALAHESEASSAVKSGSSVSHSASPTMSTANAATKAAIKRDVEKTIASVNLKRDARPAAESRRVHVVRAGDTLIEIAHQYQVSLRRLASANGLNHHAKITIGTRLEIP